MNTFNLKTTLNAYPQLAPHALLKDYVTKEDLSNTLQNYVEEAPKDSKAYARYNEDWLEVSPSALRPDISLLFGVNNLLELSNFSDTANFNEKLYSGDIDSCIIEYEQTEIGYFWIVSNVKLANILWSNVVADYIEQPSQIVSDTGKNLYCYRLFHKTIPQSLRFNLNF